MALLNTDLFVIQRPTDAGNHFKLTASKLREFVESGDTIEYKGARDFTDNTQDPSVDGTGVVNGDVYVNSATVNGTGAWAANIAGVAVAPQDRAIWNGATGQWDLIAATGDAGVIDIEGIEPIVIDDAVEAEPIISVNDALATDAALGADRTSRKGVVSAIAAAGDVVAADGVASPNPEAVVPAELLKVTNDTVVSIDERVTVNEGDIVDIKQDIVDINTEIGDITVELENITNGGGLSSLLGEDPIEVTTELIDPGAVEGDADFGKTKTTVSIKDGTTVQKGAVQLQEVGVAVSTSGTVAATPAYVSAYYLVKDFSSFADA
jgi:signal peptidase I